MGCVFCVKTCVCFKCLCLFFLFCDEEGESKGWIWWLFDCILLFWTCRTGFYFGPADEDKKEMSWTYTVLITIVGLERVASSTKNRGKFHKWISSWSLRKKTHGFSCLQGAAELARPEMLRQWLQEGADVEDGSRGWEDENGIVTWSKSTFFSH